MIMSVIVTGGAGYIGSHVALVLLDAGEHVVVVDRLSTGFRWAVPSAASFVLGDVGDESLMARVIREHDVDAIIHCAGSIVVAESLADPLGYYLNNTVKSRSLLGVAVGTGVRHFVFSSTAAVYGPPETNPVAETAPVRPISPYGSSKLMTETMLADATRAYGLGCVSLRCFNVAGADPDGRSGQSAPNATHLIKSVCETALGRRSHVEVFGTDYPTRDGTCVRDYIHVMDLAQAHWMALAHLRDGGPSGTYNCGYSRGLSVLEVIDAVRRVSGVDFEIRLSPRRAGDAAAVVAASEKIRASLGWRPQYDDLDGIVSSALQWERRLEPRR